MRCELQRCGQIGSRQRINDRPKSRRVDHAIVATLSAGPGQSVLLFATGSSLSPRSTAQSFWRVSLSSTALLNLQTRDRQKHCRCWVELFLVGSWLCVFSAALMSFSYGRSVSRVTRFVIRRGVYSRRVCCMWHNRAMPADGHNSEAAQRLESVVYWRAYV